MNSIRDINQDNFKISDGNFDNDSDLKYMDFGFTIDAMNTEMSLYYYDDKLDILLYKVDYDLVNSRKTSVQPIQFYDIQLYKKYHKDSVLSALEKVYIQKGIKYQRFFTNDDKFSTENALLDFKELISNDLTERHLDSDNFTRVSNSINTLFFEDISATFERYQHNVLNLNKDYLIYNNLIIHKKIKPSLYIEMYQNSELCYKHDPHNTLSEKIEKVFNYPKTEFPVNHPFVSKNVTINNVKTPGLATKIDLSVDKQYELTNNILSLSEYSEKGKNILLKANLITLLKNENFTDISFNLVYHDELEKRFFFYDSGLIYLEDYVNLIHFTPVAKSIQLIDLSSDKSCNLIVKNYVANSNLKTYLTNTNTLKNLDQDSLSKPNSKDIIEIINSEVLNSEQASSNLLNFKSKTLLIIACSLVFITIFLVVIFKNNPIKRKYKNLNDFDEEMR